MEATCTILPNLVVVNFFFKHTQLDEGKRDKVIDCPYI
jgi:hypothetical protein